MYKNTRVNTRLYRMKVSYRQYLLSLSHTAWIGVAPFLFTAIMWLLIWVMFDAIVKSLS